MLKKKSALCIFVPTVNRMYGVTPITAPGDISAPEQGKPETTFACQYLWTFTVGNY